MVLINPLMLVVTKVHKHTKTDLQTNLSLAHAVKELKGVLETFKEQSRNISIPLAVFFKNVALKIFQKLLENYPSQKTC